MKKSIAFLLSLSLVAGLVSPALAAGAEDYGNEGWAELGASIVRAGGGEERLVQAGRVLSTLDEKAANHGSSKALVDGSGYQFITYANPAGDDSLSPFYTFNASEEEARLRIGTLPGDNCTVVVRSEDTLADVVYAPGLGVGDTLVFQTKINVRYSVRLAWGDREGWCSLTLLTGPHETDSPYDHGVDWTAVDTSMCTAGKLYHACDQTVAPLTGGEDKVLLTAWTDGIPQERGPAGIDRLFLCDWTVGEGKYGLVKADFSQSNDPERASVSLSVYDVEAGAVTDYLTLEPEETASFLLAPGRSYRFFLTHNGSTETLRSARLILKGAEVEAYPPSDWAKADVERAIGLHLVPAALQSHYQDPITRAEFAHLALTFVAAQRMQRETAGADAFLALGGVPDGSRQAQFADLTDPDDERYVNAAYALELINGKSETIFEPDGAVTRQEAASMLMRAYHVCGGTVSGDKDDSFTDIGEVASWARDSVKDVSALGVMQGLAGNRFDPAGTYTREQAVVTFLRLDECLSKR